MKSKREAEITHLPKAAEPKPEIVEPAAEPKPRKTSKINLDVDVED